MKNGFFRRQLSAKLLVITFVFVMAAEALIFIPSAAMFRQSWLEARAQSAGLLTLAIEGVPNFEGGEMLSHRFMQDTAVTMVRQKRKGQNQLVLGETPSNARIYTVDLRKKRWIPLFRESFRDCFSKGEGVYIRILSEPTVKDAELLEVMVPQSALRAAMFDYARRVLLWSLAMAVLTGSMIYWALSILIVRPLGKLARGLKQFREDPRKRTEDGQMPTRSDEIGQLQREFIDMKSGVRQALTQQERLATLGMAMAKINHDLRNVLTSAGLIADRLASDPQERIRKIGKRLVGAVERGVKLCEATLSFSQSVEERPDMRAVRIATLIGEAAGDAMAEQGQAHFINDVDHNLAVLTDPDQTYRIFHNLFRNAVQAMSGSETKELRVRAKIKDDKACIFISDTGPGLPKKARENLFKAFTSAARKGGTGLGLTISRELARAQGGNLSLVRSDAHGTEFVLELKRPEAG